MRNMRATPRGAGSAGFTLLEAIVTLAAFSFIMTIAFGLFTRLGQVAIGNEQVARSQAGARIAVEELEKFLRSAGAEVDIAAGQRNFVWAEPYQLAFNANVTPAQDPTGTAAPAALVSTAANAGVPADGSAFYVPPADYTTGAETVVFTLDSNLDGTVDGLDKTDDPEERSDNPNDYVLYRNVYGSDAGRNTVELSPVAVVRGPEAIEGGDPVPPLFSYWIDQDDDRSTPPVLVGDNDGDGVLSAAEAAAVGPLGPRDLARIERVAVNVTSETATVNAAVEDNGGYERVTLGTEVKVRQVPRSTGVVWGVVYKDLNGDGIQDPNEPPLSGVLVQSSTGMQTRSNADGQYVLAVAPGAVTITEIDPTGYSSSTTNTLQVDAYPGSYTRVDFGDAPSGGLGRVIGKVYADDDQDGQIDNEERGIANVKIYSDTGEYTFTQADGSYTLDVPVGIRSISEVDSTGYVSTTPNTVEAEITDGGDAVIANFGDTFLEETGTIEGYVYDDTNRNAIQDRGEGGVPGAVIVVGANSTESDTQGFFSITVPSGNYTVYEEDPPGYTSTTPNILHGIRVDPDQVVTVSFGDIVRENLDFEVIELADTEKALSLAAGDLREDNRGDPDLILGTRFSGGANNLLVWHNERRNSRTPNAAIFDTTPTLSRSNPADVVSLLGEDLDGDRDIDLITGLATVTETDLNVWISEAGNLPNVADMSWHTDNGEIVWDLQKVDIDGDGIDDLLAAVDEAGTSKGHAEIWWGRGGGRYELTSESFVRRMADGLGTPLFSVTAARAADLNGDGRNDLVLSSVEGNGVSSVHVYRQSALGLLGDWIPVQEFEVVGDITHIRLMDLVEDDQGDVDIIIASATSEYTGHIEVWHQGFDGRFGLVSEAGRTMDDQMPTGGAPLSLIVTRLDNDVFPDTVVGVRQNNSYEGTVEYALGFGHLLSEPSPITEWSIGAVLTMTEADFNVDGVNDLAVGTQNSSSSGKIFVFFRQ